VFYTIQKHTASIERIVKSEMPNSGVSYKHLTKKATGHLPQSLTRKSLFTNDDSDDEGQNKDNGVEEIEEFGGIPTDARPSRNNKTSKLPSSGEKPPLKPNSNKVPSSMYGDLSSNFASKKHANTAEELDPNIYEYDAVYDSLRPQKKSTEDGKTKKASIMGNLIAAAAVRKRDATIAEEKRLAREREAEGDDFADKEKFVTSAYKKQQEDNRRIEEEERLKEEQEAKNNRHSGMSSFYKKMLEKQEHEHALVMKAVEENIKNGSGQEKEQVKEKTSAELAQEIALKEGRRIAINDDGEVVDKRDLLKGGLNVIAKPKSATQLATGRRNHIMSDRDRGSGFVGGGGKQAMRERQSRMMEAQLEQATKRALELEEDEREKVERASKSRKTEGDIMSAKERYLARKREAEELKNRGEVT
jgi:coiled-coil domain-containing protein 55